MFAEYELSLQLSTLNGMPPVLTQTHNKIDIQGGSDWPMLQIGYTGKLDLKD